MKKKSKKKKKKTIRGRIQKHFGNDSNYSLFEVVIIILISVIFGVIIGYLLTYGNSNLSRVRANTHLGEVVNTYNNIVDNYYDDVDEKKLSEYAIKGMVSSLDDPYSSFMDEDSTGSFNESVDGQYTGIGVTIYYEDEYNHIQSVIDKSPASKAGLKIGDIILMVDGKDCHNLYPDQLNQLMSGTVGSSLKMRILRGEETLSFTLKRDVIEIQNVTSKVYSDDDQKIGYIHIDLFSSNSYEQFANQLKELEEQKIQSLVIDLRNNPGGHLAQSRKILSLFFPKKTVLYQIKKDKKSQKVYSLNNEKRKYPIVILVNGETASSAEVVASCFQDNYSNAHLVGTKTYGKGNVQKSISLSNGSSIKFTVESWLTSKGVSVNGKGIVPDTIIEQDPAYYMEYLEEEDTQLQKAISLLK